MSSSLLDILCHWNAQQDPHLYQMDESGKIRIVWEYVDRRAIDIDKEVAGTGMAKAMIGQLHLPISRQTASSSDLLAPHMAAPELDNELDAPVYIHKRALLQE